MLKKVYNSDEIFFCADLHIFHKNIIRLCDRPYEDVCNMTDCFPDEDDCELKVTTSNAINEMWKDIKFKWNSKVKADDTVFILGDFIWNCSIEKCRRIMSQLNGKKVLILGNHDKETAYDHSLFEHIGKLEEIRVQYPDDENEGITKEQTFVLCHYPLASWHGSYRGVAQLFGHCHNDFPEDKKAWSQMDVGWDVKYDLFSFNDIMMQIDRQLLEKKIL